MPGRQGAKLFLLLKIFLNAMNTPSDFYPRFAKAFADAVLEHLATGEVQAIDYDVQSQDFVFGPVEPGTTPEDVGAWVGPSWGMLTGPMAAIENPANPEFSAKALHEELQRAAQESPLLIKLALHVAGEADAGELYDAKAASYRRQ